MISVSIVPVPAPMHVGKTPQTDRCDGSDTGGKTTHGFREMATMLFNEMGWNPDAIECQLAHLDTDGVPFCA